jgi:hypothetical protein
MRVSVPRFRSLRRRVSILAGATALLLVSVSAVAVTGLVYRRFVNDAAQASIVVHSPAAASGQPDRQLPADAVITVLVESYPDTARSEPAIRQLTAWLESSGHRVYYQRIDLGAAGRWRRVLAGAYTDQEYEAASWDAARLKATAPVLEARVITPTADGRR